jgi:hypothetical protein
VPLPPRRRGDDSDQDKNEAAGDATDDAGQPSPVAASQTEDRQTGQDVPIRVNVAKRVIHVAGLPPIGTSPEGARFVADLVSAEGGWVSSTEMKTGKNSTQRYDRIKKNLDPAVRSLIKSKKGTGYRITVGGIVVG